MRLAQLRKRLTLVFLVMAGVAFVLFFTTRPPQSLSAIYQQAAAETENTLKYESPNQRYFASITSSNVWIVDTVDKQAVSPFIYLRGPVFKAWSSDSRYVIFSSTNQYGMVWTNIFDTRTWKNVNFSHPCSGFEMSSCSEEFHGFTADDSGLLLGSTRIQWDDLKQSGRFD